MNLFFGCSGWYYTGWVGKFYPEGMSNREWLDHYMSEFDTVEVNSTFYHFPKESNLRSWAEHKSEGDFIFTIKMNQQVTHRKKFVGTDELVARFYRLARLLGPRLGCILFQLPPGMHQDPDKLKEILSQMDPDYNNVIEFRHPSWFNDDTYDMLREAGVALCNISAPKSTKLPETCLATAKFAFVRFHGTKDWYSSNYTKAELKTWAENLKKMEVSNLYAYFNNDYNAFAVKNCKTLIELMKS